MSPVMSSIHFSLYMYYCTSIPSYVNTYRERLDGTVVGLGYIKHMDEKNIYPGHLEQHSCDSNFFPLFPPHSMALLPALYVNIYNHRLEFDKIDWLNQ